MSNPMASRDLEEGKFFDAYADAKGLMNVKSLAFDPDKFLREETYRLYTFERLGNLRGKRGLDCGCGSGEGTVVLASRGAQVFSFDVSQNQLKVAKKSAQDNRVDGAAHFVLGSAASLAFADRSLDFAFGGGVLHHFDLPRFAAELSRVLRPGGKAVFWEPFGENALLEFARDHLPYPNKCGHSPHERALRYADIDVIRPHFTRVEVKEFELTSMIYRVVHSRSLFSLLEKLDGGLLKTFPWLRKYCRFVVISIER